MRRVTPWLALAILSCSPASCEKKGRPPAKPPPGAPRAASQPAPPSSSASRKIRFDGVYVSRGTRYSSYLRFHEDGTVVSASSPREPQEVFTWLKKSYENKGRYRIDGSDLSFSTTSPTGTVDYKGQVRGDVLSLETYSHINERRGSKRYRFHPISSVGPRAKPGRVGP